METESIHWAKVDDQGKLVLPLEVCEEFGLRTGDMLRLDIGKNDFRLHRPVGHLAKVYVEPTNRCNLECRTCIRNNWDEPLGSMQESTFQILLDDISQLPKPPSIFFGGLGEPLSHPRIVNWISAAKDLGCTVEIITNGTLLTEKRSQALIDAGLDVLWVSVDGARPDSYADVRLGAELPKVLENIEKFRRLRPYAPWTQLPKPSIGIAFVAMQNNIRELPEVLSIAKRLKADRFMVSNLLPYTDEMQSQILFRKTLRNITYLPSPWLPRLNIPKIDIDEKTGEAFFDALNSGWNVDFAGNNLGNSNDVCTFIESGSTAVGWDGRVSPCLPLLHNHVSYLHGKERRVHRHVVGYVGERSLGELWMDPDYVSYRQKVQSFDFAPCAQCGGCELSEANEEDCYGNEFPVCGGCLWAQGIVQCP